MLERIMVISMTIALAAVVAAQTPERVWNFDSDKTGTLPNGFTQAMGDWKVVSDPTAPSKPNVIAQLARSSGATFNLTLASDTHYRDLDVSLMMMAISGKNDQRRSCLACEGFQELLRCPI